MHSPRNSSRTKKPHRTFIRPQQSTNAKTLLVQLRPTMSSDIFVKSSPLSQFSYRILIRSDVAFCCIFIYQETPLWFIIRKCHFHIILEEFINSKLGLSVFLLSETISKEQIVVPSAASTPFHTIFAIAGDISRRAGIICAVTQVRRG